jgi:hypothetical protein
MRQESDAGFQTRMLSNRTASTSSYHTCTRRAMSRARRSHHSLCVDLYTWHFSVDRRISAWIAILISSSPLHPVLNELDDQHLKDRKWMGQSGLGGRGWSVKNWTGRKWNGGDARSKSGGNARSKRDWNRRG